MKINNTDIPAKEVAEMIVKRFQLDKRISEYKDEKKGVRKNGR